MGLCTAFLPTSVFMTALIQGCKPTCRNTVTMCKDAANAWFIACAFQHLL